EHRRGVIYRAHKGIQEKGFGRGSAPKHFTLCWTFGAFCELKTAVPKLLLSELPGDVQARDEPSLRQPICSASEGASSCQNPAAESCDHREKIYARPEVLGFGRLSPSEAQ